MNPSAEDIAEAVKNVNAECVIVLPNNKNIILAAEQAQYLCGGKKMAVIPTKSVPQGISSMIVFDPEGEFDENIELMSEAAAKVRTGQITHAVRDTVIDGTQIKEGDFLFIADGVIEASGGDIHAGAAELMAKLIGGETEFVTVYYGEDTTEEDAEKLFEVLKENHPECEFELHSGGQPVYYYTISAE
jgi:hypothetical protein